MSIRITLILFVVCCSQCVFAQAPKLGTGLELRVPNASALHWIRDHHLKSLRTVETIKHSRDTTTWYNVSFSGDTLILTHLHPHGVNQTFVEKYDRNDSLRYRRIGENDYAIVEEWDSLGRKISEHETRRRNKEDKTTLWKYVQDSNCIRKEHGPITEFQYFNNSNLLDSLIEWKQIAPGRSDTMRKTYYSYDGDKRLRANIMITKHQVFLDSSYYYPSGSILKRVGYSCQPSKIDSSDPVYTFECEFCYDEYGNKTRAIYVPEEVERFHLKREFDTTTSSFHYDERGRLTLAKFSNGDSVTYKWADDNRLLRERSYEKLGLSPDQEFLYKY